MDFNDNSFINLLPLQIYPNLNIITSLYLTITNLTYSKSRQQLKQGITFNILPTVFH